MDDVLALKKKYENIWRDRSRWYWAWRLFLEWLELVGALSGIHGDDPDWELQQIASIAMNFRERLSKG